jgi:phytoene synthase
MLPFSPSSESADAVDCEALTRRHARTFALASRFLPAKKRRGAFAVYAFCRVADDIVDRGANGGNRETLRHELAAYRNGLHDALEGRPTGPIFRELKWTVDEFGVPTDALLELMDGVAYDLSPTNYATWAELTSYCEGVASSVGSMCTYVFGVSGGDATRGRALQYARTLGVAMQLTNILRDVGEDAARGRCYLPEDDLSAFGITANEVRAHEVRDRPRTRAVRRRRPGNRLARWRLAALRPRLCRRIRRDPRRHRGDRL